MNILETNLYEMLKAYLMSMSQTERIELVIIFLIILGATFYLKAPRYQSLRRR